LKRRADAEASLRY
jgi:hypothetical protein